MLTKLSIDIAQAEDVIAAATRRATEMGVPQNIAIVDDAGHLVAFRRMDGAKFFSIDIAVTKAFAAAGARKATKDIGPATQPGAPAFGAQALLNGRFTTLPGGIPLVVNGAVIGAVGVSSGSVAEDQIVAEAAADYFSQTYTH